MFLIVQSKTAQLGKNWMYFKLTFLAPTNTIIPISVNE